MSLNHLVCSYSLQLFGDALNSCYMRPKAHVSGSSACAQIFRLMEHSLLYFTIKKIGSIQLRQKEHDAYSSPKVCLSVVQMMIMCTKKWANVVLTLRWVPWVGRYTSIHGATESRPFPAEIHSLIMCISRIATVHDSRPRMLVHFPTSEKVGKKSISQTHKR